jgi:asparagine synthase (glutamine-hydrolysing)
MCGIAGILGRIDPQNRAALARMSGALVHRGPDAEGEWTAAPDERGWGAMLAHRRLSILDLSPTGAQPMEDPATGNVIVFNGEIYNFVRLRERLEDRGARLRSTGDTAVLLHLLTASGHAAVAELRGMFAFAFWNAPSRRLLLARDPLGIKPLYLVRNPDPRGDWAVAFASELRALLASGLLGNPRLDLRAATSVVWNGFVVGPGTAVEGVELLWPGHLRIFDANGEVLASDYWQHPEPSGHSPVDDARLAEALEECVHLHLASDVPLAVFLSGGIDSSAVANLARRASRSPVHTFTLAFDEREYDESAAARTVAGAIGTRHQEVVLRESDFVAHLEQAIESLDQPTFDGLNSFYMARAVHEAGFKVALVGTGGDELFGGYTSFRDLPLLHSVLRRSAWIPQRLRVVAAEVVARVRRPARGGYPPQTRWAKLPDMVRRGGDLLGLYQLAYALFLPAVQRELLGGGVGMLADGLPPAMRSRITRELRGRSPLAAVSLLEQRLFLGERLLRDSDAASMASSLELRLPLVDSVLLERVVRMPDDARYRPLRRKSALRRTGLRGLDPAFFDRPKSGFVLPYEQWIRRSLGRVMDETLRDPAAVKAVGLAPDAVTRVWKAFLDGHPGLYWSRVWAIYVLVRWCQRHRISV